VAFYGEIFSSSDPQETAIITIFFPKYFYAGVVSGLFLTPNSFAIASESKKPLPVTQREERVREEKGRLSL
jgi:hypothetical protein